MNSQKFRTSISQKYHQFMSQVNNSIIILMNKRINKSQNIVQAVNTTISVDFFTLSLQRRRRNSVMPPSAKFSQVK